jgi:hypothetical protein
MRKRLIKELAKLASSNYQNRFITQATSEEYVLPDELLESAVSLLSTALQSPTLSRSLSETERRCLSAALTDIRQKDIPFDAPGFSIKDDANWVAVQKIADRCLAVLGIDLRQWEAENGMETTDPGQF